MYVAKMNYTKIEKKSMDGDGYEKRHKTKKILPTEQELTENKIQTCNIVCLDIQKEYFKFRIITLNLKKLIANKKSIAPGENSLY